MLPPSHRTIRWAPWLGAVLLAGCASSKIPAPVEERSPFPRAAAAPAVEASSPLGAMPAASQPMAITEPVKPPPPGQENLGKPGYYAVKPGDTLIRVGLENGQNWKDLVRWNNLDNPNAIEVGQVIRVVPPGTDPTAAAARPISTARVDTRPLDAKPAPLPTAGSGTASPAPTPAPAPAPAPRDTSNSDDDVQWSWPALGPVTANFDEGRTKGLVVAGKAGDPVLAAADGRVVYAGSGLRGYGNLVILKHNNTWLTAYAHNQTLLVKEDQMVKRGQKIAEMGSTDAERVQLHFEIRKQGKPVDPAKLLPPR
jgi:lipoprotein NlpD